MDCNNNHNSCPNGSAVIKLEAVPTTRCTSSVGSCAPPEFVVTSPVYPTLPDYCSLQQQQQQHQMRLILLQMSPDCTANSTTTLWQPQQEHRLQTVTLTSSGSAMSPTVHAIRKRPQQPPPPTPPSLPEQPQGEEAAAEEGEETPPPPRKKSRKGKYLLWQFLLLDLINGHSDLSWHPDQSDNPGVFAFKDPNSVAKRWGHYKENENMSYEKMSRCIRDYYIRKGNRYYGVMQPDPAGSLDDKKRRRRLHFAFNLRHHNVGQFIRKHSASYYHRLVSMRLLDSVPAGEFP